MPYIRPTLEQLIELASADIAARLPGADSQTRRSNLAVLARVIAGTAHALYGYIDWSSRQFLPDLADDENLDRLGGLWGVTRKAASYASGKVTFTGVTGTPIDLGTVLRRSDGIEYVTTAYAVIGPGVTVDVAIEASLAGASANSDVGAPLNMISPIIGVNSQTLVSVAIAGGADREADYDYRTRILARLRNPPHGGDAADYVMWAKEVPGVTRAWAFPMGNGPGSVIVRFMMDVVRAPDGIPTADDVALVADHIALVRPVTVDLSVAAPTPSPLDVLISSLQPNTPAVQNAIISELADFIRRESAPGGTLLISRMREVVSLAAGETDHILLLPAANVTVPLTHIHILGTVTFQTG